MALDVDSSPEWVWIPAESRRWVRGPALDRLMQGDFQDPEDPGAKPFPVWFTPAANGEPALMEVADGVRYEVVAVAALGVEYDFVPVMVSHSKSLAALFENWSGSLATVQDAEDGLLPVVRPVQFAIGGGGGADA